MTQASTQLSPIDGHNTLYALSTCIHCRNAQALLKEKGVPFDPIFVDKLTGDEREQVINDVRAINPRLSFPTMLTADGTVLVGISADDVKEVFGK